jgi:hypothetical protein
MGPPEGEFPHGAVGRESKGKERRREGFVGTLQPTRFAEIIE